MHHKSFHKITNMGDPLTIVVTIAAEAAKMQRNMHDLKTMRIPHAGMALCSVRRNEKIRNQLLTWHHLLIISNSMKNVKSQQYTTNKPFVHSHYWSDFTTWVKEDAQRIVTFQGSSAETAKLLTTLCHNIIDKLPK